MLISFYFTFFQLLMIYIFIYWDLLCYMLFFNHNEKSFHLKFVFKKIQYSPVVSYHYYFFLFLKKNVYHDFLSFTVLLFMYLFVRYWMLGAGTLGRPRGMVWGGRREEGGGFRMGNTCIPVVDSFWYMKKPIQYCKVKKKKKDIFLGAVLWILVCLYVAGYHYTWKEVWLDIKCVGYAFVFPRRTL